MSEAKTFSTQHNVRNVTANQNKKTVYKAVVNSPFMLKWPSVHTDLGQTIFTQLIKTIEPLGEYRRVCKENKKKKKTAMEVTEPDLNKRIFTGINQVTRRIEKYIETKPDDDKMPVIFICKREIKPLQLCQHLLYMAAMAKIRIVPLPADSEVKLSKALQLNRASVLLLEIMEDKEESLRLSTRDIPLINAPWLSNALTNLDLVHYNTTDTIKTLKTTLGNKKEQLKRKAPTDQQADGSKKKLKLE